MSKSSNIRFLAFLVGILVSGCTTMDRDNRHLQPLPAKLVALMSEQGVRQSDAILIRIFKKESELEVWKKGKTGRYTLLKTYPMCRWSGQLGPKMRSGDRQAPEGFYLVTSDRMNPRSQFYLSFDLGYPNPLEQALGYTGEALMVHGACSSAGCFAMTDNGVAEIYGLAREAFKGGQQAIQVQALPFRMTPENMVAHRDDPSMPFWRNLKDGYDYFEITRQEPTVAACGRRYIFNARPTDPAAVFDPAAPCPAYEVDADTASIVAAKQERDENRSAALVTGGQVAAAFAYADGGMHSSYRDLLRRLGADDLAKITSNEKVEISRPKAALADPYRPD